MKSNLLLACGILFVFLVFFAFVNAQSENLDKNSVSGKISKEKSEQANDSELVDFSGQGTDEIFPAGGVWQPFGPYRTINVRDKQKIVGVGSAVFGTTAGTGRIAVSLCYMRPGTSVLTAFSGNNHLIADVDSSRHTFSVNASALLPAGTYSVGYCVVNRGSQIINNNSYVSGWVMVTD